MVKEKVGMHHQKPNPNKLSIFILQATLLSFCFLVGFLCDKPCDAYAFDCGNIGYISYPFWGENQPESCGRSGFKLACVENVTMLNISSLAYRVLEINFNTSTLKVARDDLSSSICSPAVANSSLDFEDFKYPSESKDVNLTLYYDCKADDDPYYQFRCNVNGSTTFNNFETWLPTNDFTCKYNIFVPINQRGVKSLWDPEVSKITALKFSLGSGFSIQWLAVRRLSFCDHNVNGGSCIGSDGKISKPGPCTYGSFCGRVGGGMPPVQSPVQSHVYPTRAGDQESGIRQRKFRLGVISGVVIVALLVITCIVISNIRRGSLGSCCNKESNIDVESFLLQHGSLTLKRYRYSEIKKMTKSLRDKLGEGGYGSVYKGKLLDDRLVAVKVLRATDNGNGEDFINEVASISRTSHVNIVNLLGFCFDRKKRALVYEYMPNKSLDKYIGLANTDCRLDLKILCQIAIGVAKGLEYLHTGCNTRIVHFDIKPQNILLDEDFCPKISDFGLARLCKKKQSLLSVMGARGTIGYIAPEVFMRNFGGVSHKSDVYSYGMMILEMVGANTNVDRTHETTTKSCESYFPDKMYEQAISDVIGFTTGEEKETAQKMFLVGFWCIQTNPSERPPISKVVEMLEGSVESIQIPPKPVLFTPNAPVIELSSSYSSYVETQPSDEGITQT